MAVETALQQWCREGSGLAKLPAVESASRELFPVWPPVAAGAVDLLPLLRLLPDLDPLAERPLPWPPSFLQLHPLPDEHGLSRDALTARWRSRAEDWLAREPTPDELAACDHCASGQAAAIVDWKQFVRPLAKGKGGWDFPPAVYLQSLEEQRRRRSSGR